jgi:hypothetical protein
MKASWSLVLARGGCPYQVIPLATAHQGLKLLSASGFPRHYAPKDLLRRAATGGLFLAPELPWRASVFSAIEEEKMGKENGAAQNSERAAHKKVADRGQQVRPGIAEAEGPARAGLNTADDSKRADGTQLDSKVGFDAESDAPQLAATEDAFIVPQGTIDHEGPPKDPNAPSGSLSSDDDEAIEVDFGAANPAPPNT